MGYSKDYDGSFEISPSFKDPEKLNNWLCQRHFSFDDEKMVEYLEENDIPVITVDDNKVGDNGWNLIRPGSVGERIGQYDFDEYINLDYNIPPSPCPSLWSDLRVSEDGKKLYWPGIEKTYCMEEWLELLIKYVFKPGNYVINGEFNFQGERDDDNGKIIIENNELIIN